MTRLVILTLCPAINHHVVIPITIYYYTKFISKPCVYPSIYNITACVQTIYLTKPKLSSM